MFLEKLQKKICDLQLGKDFLDISKAQVIKNKLINWNSLKFKSLIPENIPITERKTPPD